MNRYPIAIVLGNFLTALALTAVPPPPTASPHLMVSALPCEQPCLCGREHAAGGWDDRTGTAAPKIDPSAAGMQTCAPPTSWKFGGQALLEPLAAVSVGWQCPASVSAKRASVAGMVQLALKDQARILQLKAKELERWSARDQAFFAHWFGTTEERARELVYERIGVELQINEAYSVRNFRRAPHRPGVFAFVRPSDPSRMFLDLAFVRAPRVGENSRAGTFVHEMSHFVIAGGTKDFVYGTAKCRRLARANPALALNNADNFEFWAENAR